MLNQEPTRRPQDEPPVRDRTPRVEIREDADAFWLAADMPGVAPDAVSVSLDDGVLALEGRTAGPGTPWRYRRRVTLVDPSRFDTEHIAATMRHGVLELRIPKAAQLKPRRIPVTVH